MAYLQPQRPEKVTVPGLRQIKERGEPLVCLTAYDYPTARVIDDAGTVRRSCVASSPKRFR